MRSAVTRVGSVLVLAALLFGVFAAPASAITPGSLEWPTATHNITSSTLLFGYRTPRPLGLSPYAVYPYYTRIALTISANAGEAVGAAEEGVVVFVGKTQTGYAAQNMVLIQHHDDVDQTLFVTSYVGIVPSVKAGDPVLEGQQIGTVHTYYMPGYQFSVRRGIFNTAAYWYNQNYYGMATLPSNAKYQPAMWHFPSDFVDPMPLFE